MNVMAESSSSGSTARIDALELAGRLNKAEPVAQIAPADGSAIGNVGWRAGRFEDELFHAA